MKYTRKTRINDTTLSIRTKNCCSSMGLLTIEDLLNADGLFKASKVAGCRGFGSKSYNELIEFIEQFKQSENESKSNEDNDSEFVQIPYNDHYVMIRKNSVDAITLEKNNNVHIVHCSGREFNINVFGTEEEKFEFYKSVLKLFGFIK